MKNIIYFFLFEKKKSISNEDKNESMKEKKEIGYHTNRKCKRKD